MAIRPVDNFSSSLKKLRTLQAVELVSLFLLAYSGEVLGPPQTKGITTIGYLLLALTAFNIWLVFSWRRRQFQEARQLLLSRPSDGNAIKRWHFVNLVLLADCESIGLFGCLIRVWGGGTLPQAVPFYICALILLLAFTPRHLPVQLPVQAKGDSK
jgi:hypothetical protein